MPEEVNRILTDRISDILFCPTDSALENLKKEGFDHFDISVVKSGDVMQDAALYYAQFSADKSQVHRHLPKGDYVLCTLHRAENTDDQNRLREIVNALDTIHKSTPVVMPLHPRTKKLLEKYGIALDVTLIDPVGYFDMIELLKGCKLVMTDSGGLQKEAFFFQKNCITLRDQTEWVELVEHGFNVLAEAVTGDILDKFEVMSTRPNNFDIDLYGNGKAAQNILREIRAYFAI